MARNPYLLDFRDLVNQKFAEDSDTMSYGEWIRRNTTINRKPFTTKGYEFQDAILDDMSPSVAVIKPSQVGLTECSLRKFAAFVTRNNGTTGIFTLPDEEMFKRISQTRWSPMLKNDKVFNLSAEKPIRSIGLSQINDSFAYFTGMSEGDATSIAADVLFHDELDLSDQEMIALYQSRLQNSQHRITQSFSTPTFEGFGIHALFLASDQKYYQVKCNHCSHWSFPRWTPEFVHLHGLSSDVNDFKNISQSAYDQIDLTRSYVMCPRCHKRLDLGDPSKREWVAKYPGRKSRGYWISPFSTPRLGIDYILDQQVKYQRGDALRRFYNTVLGEPFQDDKARLSEVAIRAVMDNPGVPEMPAKTPVVVGIDVGATCTLVVITGSMAEPHVIEWRLVPEDMLITTLDELAETYNIVGGGIDRYPYTPLSNEIRDRFNGRIFPIEYSSSGADIQAAKDEFGKVSHMRGNRTAILDAVALNVRKKKITFSGFGQQDHIIVQHLRDMVRTENAAGVGQWVKLNGNDHFFHALGYGLFAYRILELPEHTRSRSKDEKFMLATAVVTSTAGNHSGSLLGFPGVRRGPISGSLL